MKREIIWHRAAQYPSFNPKIRQWTKIRKDVQTSEIVDTWPLKFEMAVPNVQSRTSFKIEPHPCIVFSVAFVVEEYYWNDIYLETQMMAERNAEEFISQTEKETFQPGFNRQRYCPLMHRCSTSSGHSSKKCLLLQDINMRPIININDYYIHFNS